MENKGVLALFLLLISLANIAGASNYYVIINNGAGGFTLEPLSATLPIVVTANVVSCPTCASTSITKYVASINGMVGTVNLIPRNAIAITTSATNNIYVDMPQASGTVNGYLSSGDWTTFNGKQNSIANYVPSISQGTSIAVSATNQISLGTLTLSEIPVNMQYTFNSQYVTSSSSYNTIYDTNSISWSKFFSTLGTSNDIRFNFATNTFTDLPPYNSAYLTSTYNSVYNGYTNYNSAYWTGTNYNSVYAGFTNYNSAYWTGTNYNSVYAGFTNYNSAYAYTGANDIKITGTVITDLPPYNSAYWTGTNYNSFYLTSASTYNGIYDTNSISLSEFFTTLGTSNDIRFNSITNTITDLPPYNSQYQTTISNYVPSISAGTGVSISATNAITALPSYNSFYLTASSSYNSVYDNLILNYFPYNNLKAGTGISIATNTITATGYNSIYDNLILSYLPYNNLKAGTGISISTNTITATGYNSIYAGYVPSISAGTYGIAISGANVITSYVSAGTGLSATGNTVSMLALTGGTGIAISSTNNIAEIPQTAGTGIGVSGNTVSMLGLTAGTYGTVITSTNVISSYVSAGTGLSATGNTVSMLALTPGTGISISSTNTVALSPTITTNTVNFNTLTPNNAFTTITTNYITANTVYLTGFCITTDTYAVRNLIIQSC